jgi:short-subunit dehydrogenase
MNERRILIIGCSDGIGLATAKRLVKRGFSVSGISRSPSPLVDERYTHVVADVVSNEYLAVLRSLVERGPFDACIYCAGIGEFFDVNRIAQDEHVFAVNLTGALRTAQAILPPMVEAGRGQMIVLSSQVDEVILPAAPSYAASKAALSAYFQGLGLALRPQGVAITTIRFGFVDTKMARSKYKPFCISAEKAAEIIEGCLEKRPLRLTRPLRAAALTIILRWLGRWRIRLG